MKVLLVNSPPYKILGVFGQMYPSLGLMYIASYCREQYQKNHPKTDFDIKIYDGYQEKYPNLVKKILSYKPDVLGLSFSTQAATGAYKLIKELRTHPDFKKTLIVCGGPHPTAIPLDVFKHSSTDLTVIGEGEITFYEILRASEQNGEFTGIRGVAYYEENKVVYTRPRPLIEDLDILPFPARDLIDVTKYAGYYYKKERSETHLISSRGCPFNCVYCSNPVWKTSKPWYRVRSPKNVADEIEYIRNELGIKEIYDNSDEFNANLPWAKALCDEIVRRGIKASLKAQMRSDNIDDELAKKMAAAGFWMAFLGIESGNLATLKGINKKTTPEMNYKAFKTLKQAGVKTFALLMAFNVWEENGELKYEDVEATNRTLEYARGLVKEKVLDLMSWSITTPYPGSELFDLALRHNLISKEIMGQWELLDQSERLVMKLPGITYGDWVKIQNQGKKLQAYLLLKSRTFNLRSVPMYFKRGISQLLKALKLK